MSKMITGISHTNIRVRDIDRCLPFYRDVLGLKVSWDERDQDISGDQTKRRRAVFLRWNLGPHQGFVVLQSFPSRDGTSEPEPAGHQTKLSAMGLNHFGFWVDEFETIVARAVRAGVQMVRDGPVTCIARHYGYDDPSDDPCV